MTLIEKLERAEGPSRELDAEIWIASGAMPPGLEDLGCYDDPATGCVGGTIYHAPAYTKSTDAALTLEDEDDGWMSLTVEKPFGGEWTAIARKQVFMRGTITVSKEAPTRLGAVRLLPMVAATAALKAWEKVDG